MMQGIPSLSFRIRKAWEYFCESLSCLYSLSWNTLTESSYARELCPVHDFTRGGHTIIIAKLLSLLEVGMAQDVASICKHKLVWTTGLEGLRNFICHNIFEASTGPQKKHVFPCTLPDMLFPHLEKNSALWLVPFPAQDKHECLYSAYPTGFCPAMPVMAQLASAPS